MKMASFSQLRNAKVWLPTECAAFCAAPTEAPSYRVSRKVDVDPSVSSHPDSRDDRFCLEMIFGWPKLNDGKLILIQILLFPIFQKTNIEQKNKLKGSKLYPNKGNIF